MEESMAEIITFDQNSNSIRVYLQSSVDGTAKTGLTFESTGLIISTIADNEATATAYTAAAGKIETIATLGTYVTPTDTKCRFKEVDATNHPGIYEIQIADARFSVANAKTLLVAITGVSGLATCHKLISLTRIDMQRKFRY
jgi:hypothetical protein